MEMLIRCSPQKIGSKFCIVAILLCAFFFNCFVFAESTTDQVILFDEDERIEFTSLTNYQAALKKSLRSNPPLLNLLPINEQQKRALNVALQEERFTSRLSAQVSGKSANAENSALLNELFSIRPFRAGDLNSESPHCKDSTQCWTAEVYSYTVNTTHYAVIDLALKKVVEIRSLSAFQPEIPDHLESLAKEIARNHPRIAEEIKSHKGQDFVMAGTKSSLNRTRCERSRHLCVAPTFVIGEQALWAIVDLVDHRVVGTRRTKWKDNAPIAFTEQQITDQYLLENMCQKSVSHTEGKWRFNYQLTFSDGVEFLDVHYKDRLMIKSFKNVDWHVSYSDKDGVGYSDAIGCPIFSAAAVVPATLPKTKPLDFGKGKIGAEFHQDFLSKQWPLPCNYYYEVRLQMFNDATLRPAVGSVGRGCGSPGIYRPVVRLEFAAELTELYEWRGNVWKRVEQEIWRAPLTKPALSPQGYQYKLQAPDGAGLYIEPGYGQFFDNPLSDNAYIYFVVNHPNKQEGAQDLPTIGPCCNNDHRQGPERFIDDPPEKLKNVPIVMWYVPQMTNNDTPGKEYCWGSTALKDGKVEKLEYPCVAGPMITPFEAQKRF